MTPSIEWLLLIGGALVIASVLASKLSGRLGLPALVIFLAIGMLAGSDGPGGIYFDNAALAQAVGVTALAFIMFSGGLDTPWQRVKPVAASGLVLATLGVALTAASLGLFAIWALDLPLGVGLLIGAVVSSTDAAAVFSILRSKATRLAGNLEPLLELESGSNDPMAVLLTVGLIDIIAKPGSPPLGLLGTLLVQLGLGALAGILFGRGGVALINRLRLQQEGLYNVATVALVALAYSFTQVIGGSGFLAVYIAGIIMGNSDLIHKKSLVSFHDSLAWLMQITMFLTLGLLVFPSQLLAVVGASLAIAIFLIVVARPLAVFICLSFSRYSMREKLLISWVGLRGATPIILAAFPLLAGLPEARLIFNVIFFVVITSVLIQGTTITQAARLLGLVALLTERTPPPLREQISEHLLEVQIPDDAAAAGKRIIDLHLPREVLLVLIERNGAHIIPTGSTELLAGDSILLTTSRDHDAEEIKQRLL